MACPKCGCKVHYQFNEADFGQDDERLERCAACGEVFDIEDAADEGRRRRGFSSRSAAMMTPQKIEVRLSGHVRVRPGLFGRIVPQVELRTLAYSACPPMPGRDPMEWDRQMRADGVTSYTWRDATWDDMQLIGVMVPAHWARDAHGVSGQMTAPTHHQDRLYVRP